MTKEQTLAAIEQAISTGEIKDVDTGFVTKIKEQNSGAALSFWVGTSAEYNAIEEKENNCFYILTDETTGDDFNEAIKTMREDIDYILERKNIVLPEITITTVYGGVVTLIDGKGKEIQGRADGESWVFEVAKYGDYTIKCVKGATVNNTHVITIDAVKQYSFETTHFAPNFAANSWSDIILAVENNIVPETWQVGDTKTLTADKEYSIRIIGKYHDTYKGLTTKAPLTLAFAPNADYTNAPIKNQMFNYAQDPFMWEKSDMRNTHLPAFLATLPQIIQDGIKEVKKAVSAAGGGAGSNYYVNDSIFLLSELEITGSGDYAPTAESGAQYEYYKNGNKDYTTSTSVVIQWTRSGYRHSGMYGVTYNVTSTSANASIKEVETELFAYPAFCF